MNVAELVSLFRQYTQDAELPGSGSEPDEASLFKNHEIVEYFNEAQQEFARRTEVLFNSRTTALTQFTTTAGDPWVAVAPEILSIKHARWGDSLLRLKNHRGMDEWYGDDWESASGTPVCLVLDMEVDSVRLYPTPEADGLLKLRVTHLPREVLEVASDEPEIPAKHHRLLLHYALYLAFSKHDADAFDKTAAALSLQRFEQAVLKVRSEVSIRYKKGVSVRYGGI